MPVDFLIGEQQQRYGCYMGGTRCFQGQPVPESVSERETPAIIPLKPPEKGLLRAFTSLLKCGP